MANAFGLDVDELEKQVVKLIESGEIKARVDSQNKVGRKFYIFTEQIVTPRFQILKAKKEDHRTAVFSRAIKTGTEMMETNRKLLLRMRLCVFLPCSPFIYVLNANGISNPGNKPISLSKRPRASKILATPRLWNS